MDGWIWDLGINARWTSTLRYFIFALQLGYKRLDNDFPFTTFHDVHEVCFLQRGRSFCSTAFS